MRHMDLSKTFSIGTDYKDRRSNPNWETHTFSEIVFIDKTHQGAAATLYQLKNPTHAINHQTLWESNLPNLSEEAFVLIGEIASIDRKNKKIFLANQNSVAYNYLIVSSGTKQMLSIRAEEFTAGLQALIDALRVKPKIPASFAAYLNPLNPAALEHSRSSATSKSDNSDIKDVVQPQIASANEPKNFELNSINKRLFEVQI